MSILSRNLLQNPTCRASLLIQSPNLYRISKSTHLPKQSHLKPLTSGSLRSHGQRWQIKVSDSNNVVEESESEEVVQFNFDNFLSLWELICVVSSLVVSVGCVVKWGFLKHKNWGLWNMVLMASAVVLGTVIRLRQWRRLCGVPDKASSGRQSQSQSQSPSGNVIQRIEKLEDSLRSSTTIIRVLSRQLEKLGIRFRVTRKTLKDPIAETAALAQRNSEVTRALAAQQERLEKELGELQKVLLAMQDQQQKQIELILAIAKNGKLFETKKETSQKPDVQGLHGSEGKVVKETGSRQVQASARQNGTNNEKV